MRIPAECVTRRGNAVANNRGMPTVLAIIVALLFELIMGVGPGASQEPASGTRASTYALEVLEFDLASPSRLLWVGIVNRSGSAQLICIVSRGIAFNDEEGTWRFVAEGASPHSCLSDDQFTLIQAAGTSFIPLSIPASLKRLGAATPIKVQVGIIERGWSSTPSDSVLQVTWAGTVKQALEHGSKVMGPSSK